MREPRFWSHPHSWQATLLAPLAWGYGWGEATRWRTTQPRDPRKPVICVGNFTIGGAGKTPTVRWLATWLKARGFSPAILARGYGGRIKHTQRVAWHHNAAQVGDEPMLLAQTAPTYIGRDRHQSLDAAIADGADCAIKDDGFQNPTMRHCFNLVVVEASTGIGNAQLLPAGPLRQALAVGMQRADALLVLNEGNHPSLDMLHILARQYKTPLFRGRFCANAPQPKRVLAYCGIATPQKFFTTLETTAYDLAGTQCFPDHHNFREGDAQMLHSEAARLGATLITTEKDIMRLKDAPAGSARARLADVSEVLHITLQIDNETALQHHILDAIAQFAPTTHETSSC